jgi:hypothetical protein
MKETRRRMSDSYSICIFKYYVKIVGCVHKLENYRWIITLWYGIENLSTLVVHVLFINEIILESIPEFSIACEHPHRTRKYNI